MATNSAMSWPQTDLPRRIGRYEAFLQIGAGGMARVYLCMQRGPFSTKKLVVLKQVRREIASDPQYREMFIDEARIAVRLQHPNVIHTYEVLDESPDYYLSMEFLDGQSLLDLLNRVGRQQLPVHDHVWILTQLLAGLHYAHELRDFGGRPLNIVHRDVTPSNVFLCRSGAVKLLDFGIAKAAGAVAATRNGLLKGKLGYVSPEQCLGHPATPRSDIYAVGVMLWEAMARRRRATGESLAAQMQARIQGLEPPIDQVWPQAPSMLTNIARRALELKPEDRYVSAQEFQHELERYLTLRNHRTGAESIRRLLSSHFSAERAALYRAIDARLGAADPQGSREVAPWSESLETTLVQANDNRAEAQTFVSEQLMLPRAPLPDRKLFPRSARLHRLLLRRAREILVRARRAAYEHCVMLWQRLRASPLVLRASRNVFLVAGTLLCGALMWHIIDELQQGLDHRPSAAALAGPATPGASTREQSSDELACEGDPAQHAAPHQDPQEAPAPAPAAHPAQTQANAALKTSSPAIDPERSHEAPPAIELDRAEAVKPADAVGQRTQDDTWLETARDRAANTVNAAPPATRAMSGAMSASTPTVRPSAGQLVPGMDLPPHAEGLAARGGLDEQNPYEN